MSESLKKVISTHGYEIGYQKYIIDHPSSAERIKDKIEKYGLKDGIDLIIEENTKRCSNTKDKFIKLYGEEDGILRWEKFKKPRISKKRKSKPSLPTLEKYIEKYGEETGIVLWNKYKDSLSFTKENCIEKYGKEEGGKKYSAWKKSQDHSSKEFMIKKYGIENGLKKYKEVGCKRAFHSDAYHSKISQELFETIKNVVNNSNTEEFKYASNGGELRLYDKIENKAYYYDFAYKNKIIEYNGDFWHANPEMYSQDDSFKNGLLASEIWEKDAKKTTFAKMAGYDILVIWHSEYKKDKVNTLEKCLNFLTNNTNNKR